MIIQSHPTGNVYVRQTAQALIEAQLLAEFWTCLNFDPDARLARWLPVPLRRQLERRSFSPAVRARARTLSAREIGRLLSPALKLGALTRHETGVFSVDAVFRALDRRVARRLKGARARGIRGVYAPEDGALRSFGRAKREGLVCFYELPIAYWETGARLLAQEAARWPQWAPTLVGTHNSAVKLARKTRELELADVVITPSQFVFDSLPPSARDSKKCVVVPFGSPLVEDELAPEHEENRARPLRVLFAGSMTQRKGLADLFAAIQLLNRSDVELIVLGSPVAPLEFYHAQGAPFRWEAPRPHGEVLQLMRSCDVLALPSIVEGRALVQQEALACGLPILVTPNAGGQDLIVEGENGFLVPIRAPERIAEKIAWLADNRDQLPAMRLKARATAARCGWDEFRAGIVAAVQEGLEIS